MDGYRELPGGSSSTEEAKKATTSNPQTSSSLFAKTAAELRSGNDKHNCRKHQRQHLASSVPSSFRSSCSGDASSSQNVTNNDSSNKRRQSRKRRRVVLPSTTAARTGAPTTTSAGGQHPGGGGLPPSLTVATATTGDSTEQHHHDGHVDEPDLGHFRQLLAALLLTTGLSLMSALDAKEQCLQHETYALLDLVDDDNFQKAYVIAIDEGSGKCMWMFYNVLCPTFGITLGLGAIAMLLIYWYTSSRRQQQFSQHPSQYDPPSRGALSLTGELLVLSIGVLCVQTYSILAVMLRPRATSEDDNPYQSLAAVDRYGRVGDNANLFYLSWMSEGLALALVYQLGTATARLCRTARPFTCPLPLAMTPQALLPAASWDFADDTTERESRAMWFQSLYKLRFRTGVWTAALLACLVIVASSHHVWNQVVWPIARHYARYYARQQEKQQEGQEEYGDDQYSDYYSYYSFVDDDFMDDSGNNDQEGEPESSTNVQVRHHQVCQLVAAAGANPQLCRRTVASWLSGMIATGLCSTAIGMHLAARQTAATARDHTVMWERVFVEQRLPLRTELFLGVLLSLLLGFNAFFCTGVQGPAATVGNLYYASWISFLLVVRICLGCVEEHYNIEESSSSNGDGKSTASNAIGKSFSQHGAYEAPSTLMESASSEGYGVMHRSISQVSHETQHFDPQERNRIKRLRAYFFLCIFSIVCAASGYDAASNQNSQLSRGQTYMILAPCIVATLSALLFGLCLSKRCYLIVSHFLVGGILAVLCFGLWLVDLILTMHSEDSWAVDKIGEIKMANLVREVSKVACAFGTTEKSTSSNITLLLTFVFLVLLLLGWNFDRRDSNDELCQVILQWYETRLQKHRVDCHN